MGDPEYREAHDAAARRIERIDALVREFDGHDAGGAR
jgi:hypothetical protein